VFAFPLSRAPLSTMQARNPRYERMVDVITRKLIRLQDVVAGELEKQRLKLTSLCSTTWHVWKAKQRAKRVHARGHHVFCADA
jgi:hypothetical protein